jgi:hypothetical protein
MKQVDAVDQEWLSLFKTTIHCLRTPTIHRCLEPYSNSTQLPIISNLKQLRAKPLNKTTPHKNKLGKRGWTFDTTTSVVKLTRSESTAKEYCMLFEVSILLLWLVWLESFGFRVFKIHCFKGNFPFWGIGPKVFSNMGYKTHNWRRGKSWFQTRYKLLLWTVL